MSDQEDTGQLAVRRAGMEHKGDFKPAANLLTQLARGWAAGTAGLPGDLEGLARLVQKYTTLNPAVRALDATPVLPTSEFYKEWLPGADNGVGGKELNSIGSLFGGVGAGTAASGAADLGKGALTLASKAARNAAVPRTLSTQAGVIKAPGGNWLSGSVEDALRPMKRSAGPGINGGLTELPPADVATNAWIDKQLTRYIKNDMATERDPVRALAESGVLHVDPEQLNFRPEMHGKYLEAGQTAVAQNPLARVWEGAADNKVFNNTIADFTNDWVPDAYTGASTMDKNPWMSKLPPHTPIHALAEPRALPADLGFDHLLDELRNATNPASGLPRGLQLDIKSLDRLSVPQAVERVARINDWRAAQQVEASQAIANNPAAHLLKEYPHTPETPNPKGLRWVELKQPEARLAEGHAPGPVSGYPSLHGIIDSATGQSVSHGATPEEALKLYQREERIKHLADQLKYEGDTMGHCVGGYCDDVARGNSRILSLRDAKGQPHVTVEVKNASAPKDVVNGFGNPVRITDPFEHFYRNKDMSPSQIEEAYGADFADMDVAAQLARVRERTPRLAPKLERMFSPEPARLKIEQIKGKSNLAPNAEYLPFVQDLVRGGLGGDLTNWERVGDLSNAGMVKMGGGVTRYRAAAGAPPVEYKMPEGYMTLREAADYLIKQGAPEKWAKQHLGVSLTDGYASGGSVPNNPYTIDAAAFHSAVDPLLGDANMWQAHDDSPQKLALQLGNGATWNVGGGEGTYGSGVYKYDPITEADDKRYQEALAAYNATGLAIFNPDNIAVGSGSKADRDNMLESWLGSGGALGALRAGAQGFDTGESGHVEGHTPTAEEWAAALAKDAPGYDPNKPIYRVRGDMSQLLGKPDSRMFLDAGYQEIDGRMVPLGTPSRTYQKSVGAENISMLSALLAPYSVGMALNNAAAGGGSAMAQAAAEANAANAAQGFGQLGMAGAAPAAGLGEQAIAAYQAAQPYLKAANTVGALARGNPMGALGGYLPGMDLGLGDFGNTVANGAVKAGLSGGNPLLGAVSGAVGDAIPDTLRPYLPLAQGLVAATEGKLSLTQALNMLARYNSSSSKGA